MAQSQKPATHSPAPTLNKETVDQLIQLQFTELGNRKSEIQLRHEELKYNSLHAEKILDAQVKDREDERKFELKKGHSKLCFYAFCIVVLTSLIAYGIYLGKDAFVTDVIKILSGLVTGAIGGYGFRVIKEKSKDNLS